MTAKTYWTLNHLFAALLIVAGLAIFTGCAEDNDAAYNGSASNGTVQTYTADKTAKTSSATNSVPARDSSTGMSNYDAAINRAKAQNKPVYLLFTATWCGPCQSYKRTVLSDYEVKDALNTNVIFVNVDIDRDKALARKYNVSGVPAGFLVKVDDKGQAQTVNSHVGGMEKQEFMNFIKK